MAYLPPPVSSTNPAPGTASGTVSRIIFPIEHLSAFGDLEVAQKQAIITLNFNYAINSFFVATTVANGGTVTQATGMAVLQTSTATNGSAILQSRAAMRYLAGTGCHASFSALFTTGVASSTQLIGLGDANDGIFWGYQGTAFGVFQRNATVDTFTAQTAFSIDKLDGTGPSAITLDPTKLNLYKVQFGWHGSGALRFYVMDVLHGRWILAHVISAAVTSPRFLNPILPVYVNIVNTGNNTNLIMKTASMGAYREMSSVLLDVPYDGYSNSAGNNKTNTTELNIISLRNNSTVFSGQVNKVRIKMRGISFAGNNQTLTVRAVLNTTLGGSPSFTDTDSNTSVSATDTAGTTISGGRETWRGNLGSGGGSGNVYVDLSDMNMVLNPGDVLTFSALSGGSQNVSVGIQWLELFSG